MSKKTQNVLQQGQADGLCGIYCILNFLLKTEEWRDFDSNKTLRYILHTVEELNWLTPHYITYGYDDYQIKKILDKYFEIYRMSYVSYYIDDFKISKKFESFSELAESVCNGRGSVIVDNGEEHWVLVTGDKSGIIVEDSDNTIDPKKSLSDSKKAFSLKWGIVILRRERATLEIEL